MANKGVFFVHIEFEHPVHHFFVVLEAELVGSSGYVLLFVKSFRILEKYSQRSQLKPGIIFLSAMSLPLALLRI